MEGQLKFPTFSIQGNVGFVFDLQQNLTLFVRQIFSQYNNYWFDAFLVLPA